MAGCGNEQEEPAQRDAYQPGQEETTSASPSSSPDDATASQSNQSTGASDEPSEAEECTGSNYDFPVLRGGITCQDAKVLVEEVILSGATQDNGVVTTSDAYCRPGGSNWNCGYLPEGSSEIEVQVRAKDAFNDPLRDVDSADDDTTEDDDEPSDDAADSGSSTDSDSDSGAEADIASDSEINSSDLTIECEGQLYDFTRVDDLTCNEAKGILDPFTPGDAGTSRISDAVCTAEDITMDGQEAQRWSCTRDAGGSFLAFSR